MIPLANVAKQRHEQSIVPKVLMGPLQSLGRYQFTTIIKGKFQMDKDRVKGSAEQAKGKVKEVAGKVTGDSKLEGEGKADQVSGKIKNTIGGIKDTLRGK